MTSINALVALFCVTGTAMNAKSDEAGFILVMPNGYQNSWNAGTCCGGASAEQLDDVALFRAILDEVGEHVNIDLDRVYATGLSNGASSNFWTPASRSRFRSCGASR